MMKMRVNQRRARRMIDIIDVNVRGGRLIEAQQQRRYAQDCTDGFHVNSIFI
jgi:hypothetical protein